jgi:hypothetical protein
LRGRRLLKDLLDPLLGESFRVIHGEASHAVAPNGLKPFFNGAKEEAS